MKCPYCSTEFSLTWKRYFQSPFGRHVCPNCKKKSKLKHTKRYWLFSYIPMCLIAGCFTYALLLILGEHDYTMFLAFGVALFIGLPIDRWGDNRFAIMVRIEGREGDQQPLSGLYEEEREEK